MEEKELGIPSEIEGHIRAIAEWVAEDDKRAAFLAVGEHGSKHCVAGCGLFGPLSRVTNLLCAIASDNKSFKLILECAAIAVKDPVAAAYVKHEATKGLVDKDADADADEEKKSKLRQSLAGLLGTIADKLKEE